MNQAQIWKGSDFAIERREGYAAGTVIFRLSGPFTARGTFSSLSPQALRNLFESPSDEAPALTIFDLSEVPYMDSMGLGMIVSQYARCQGKGVRMVVAGATARVLELLQLTKVDRFIPMAATVAEAEGC